MDEGFRKGDIIVTAVANHYAIGRIIVASGTQEHVTSVDDREVALEFACKLAGPAHRVFLHKSAGKRHIQPVDCEEIPH